MSMQVPFIHHLIQLTLLVRLVLKTGQQVGQHTSVTNAKFSKILFTDNCWYWIWPSDDRQRNHYQTSK